MSSTVVVQELFWEVAARNCDSCTSSDIAINQECAILTQGAELRQDILATSDHLNWIVSSDVSREKFGCTCLLDASAHSFHHLWNAFVHLAENLVALRLIVLDEISSLPEGVARLAERLWLQTQLRLDDRANDEATIRQRAAEHTPHNH
jgi:hypothetical protein